ncbi:SUMF1/EgtB/PvdO family nonheme iron enzyme [candidate division KSB1 bacterium]|nr:SUMF1/EgtB/PvdO family nonheme iron enzyme [candidate division KSB1 bacterium]
MKRMMIWLAFYMLMGIAYPYGAEENTDVSEAAQKVDTTNTAVPEQKIEQEKADSGKSSVWEIIGPIATALAFVLAVITFITRKKQTQQEEQIKKDVEYGYKKEERAAQEKSIAIAQREGEQKFIEELQEATHKSEEDILRNALSIELGTIRLLGSPDIPNLPVSLLDSFVSLDISETWRSETRFNREEMPGELHSDRLANPDTVMQRAFQRFHMLLIIGDPGSGKTTLLKYYGMTLLKGDHARLGFKNPLLPLYLPLRELEDKEGELQQLPEALASWAKRHELLISRDTFYNWLHSRDTLVLLDGLDEISDIDKRRRVCQWIDEKATGLTRARFVVTSRWTGYRKLDGIEIGFDHVRADVRDFNAEQQGDFLRKWFCAVYDRELPEEGEVTAEFKERQRRLALQRAETIIAYLQKKENQGIRELAATPMLLQIIAIIWKERQHLPQSRARLYSAALSYLLDFRDRRRRLNPLLPADKALLALTPTALWMQEEIGRDEVAKTRLHDYMQGQLDTLQEPPKADKFCENLRDRAGLIADYGATDYIFRHKSFREYLCGLQLAKKGRDKDFLAEVVTHFGDDWWEEPLRYFMSESDDVIFDRFMEALFHSPVSKELDQKAQNLLQQLVLEAPAKRSDALEKCLNNRRLAANKKRYILDCLKTMGTAAASEAIRAYSLKTEETEAVLDYAEEIIAQAAPAAVETRDGMTLFQELPKSFRNSFEDNAEYLLIPGGRFRYSVTKKGESIATLYFAKYPVTIKRYKRFLDYLAGNNAALNELLPPEHYAEELLAVAPKIEKNYSGYLGSALKDWPQKMRIKETDKKFLGDDQPVMRVTWYDAMAYCVWLTLLGAQEGRRQLKDAKVFYRLPREREWEWAAAGREPDGSLRDYPWPKDKGGPSDKLANYRGNVGVTTPVGRYPDGATPEGLLDMAGNVWEWQLNKRSPDWAARALRGGAWDSYEGSLRCSARHVVLPDYHWNFYGFRVVLAESHFLDL